MRNIVSLDDFLKKTSEELKLYHKLKITCNEQPYNKMLMIQLEGEDEHITCLRFTQSHYGDYCYDVVLQNKTILDTLCKVIPILTNLKELDISGYSFIGSSSIDDDLSSVESQKKLFGSISHCKKLKKLNIENNYFNFIDNDRSLFQAFIGMFEKCIYLEKISWSINDAIVHIDNRHLPAYLPDLFEKHQVLFLLKKKEEWECSGHGRCPMYSDEYLLREIVSEQPYYDKKSVRYTEEQEKLLKKILNKKSATIFFAFAFGRGLGDVKKIILDNLYCRNSDTVTKTMKIV